MKVIGKRSVASLVGVVIQVAWYGQLVLYSFAGIVLLIAFGLKGRASSDIPVTLQRAQPVAGLVVTNAGLQNTSLKLNVGMVHVEQKVSWPVILAAAGFFVGFVALGLLITHLLRQIFDTL